MTCQHGSMRAGQTARLSPPLLTLRCKCTHASSPCTCWRRLRLQAHRSCAVPPSLKCTSMRSAASAPFLWLIRSSPTCQRGAMTPPFACSAWARGHTSCPRCCPSTAQQLQPPHPPAFPRTTSACTASLSATPCTSATPLRCSAAASRSTTRRCTLGPMAPFICAVAAASTRCPPLLTTLSLTQGWCNSCRFGPPDTAVPRACVTCDWRCRMHWWTSLLVCKGKRCCCSNRATCPILPTIYP